MDAMETVRKCASDAGMPLTRIGLELGHSRQYVHGLMQHSSTPKADTLARMLDVCGYKLCAVPDDMVSDDMYVID